MWLQLECGGGGEDEEINKPRIFAERTRIRPDSWQAQTYETKQKTEQLEVRKVGLPPLFLHTELLAGRGGGKPTFLTLSSSICQIFRCVSLLPFRFA